MDLKVYRLTETSKIPTKAFQTDAGLDLYSNEDKLISENSHEVIATGIAMAIPKGYFGMIRPRSGMSVKYGYNILAGIIDADFRNEVKVVIQASEKALDIKKGDKIAQMLILPVPEIDVVEVRDINDLEKSLIGPKNRIYILSFW